MVASAEEQKVRRGLPVVRFLIGCLPPRLLQPLVEREAARPARADVKVEIYPRMWHVWQIYPTLPEATQSLGDIAQFLGEHLRVPHTDRIPAGPVS